MNASNVSKLQGITKLNEPMAKHSSWKIGGNADVLYIPKSIDDLSTFLKQQPVNTNVTFIGLGSNVLIRDNGIRGVVILMKGGPSEIELTDHVLMVDAGTSCAKLSRYAIKNGLNGLAFLAGIPGTIGGAMAMNAGAFGSEIWTFLQSALLIDKRGGLREKQKAAFDISYRSISLAKDQWFAKAFFNVKICKETNNDASIKSLLDKRKQSQPIGLASCGSVFKNPKDNFAAQLIEQVGLKGYQIGQAQISPKHANFIINLGGAKACDVEQLIAHIQTQVNAKCNVQLEPEVRFIGEAA